MDLQTVIRDLDAEQSDLESVVASLPADGWATPTPGGDWSVADQIAHLTYFDRAATAAIVDPPAFAALADELFTAALTTVEAADEVTLGWARAGSNNDLLGAWQASRAKLLDAAATLGESDRVDWYGPSMGSKSFLTARMMEAWGPRPRHRRRIGRAAGPPPERLAHIARLGFNTRGWSYANRGEEAPATEVSVTLTAPSGEIWTFGPAEAVETITGPAGDFCLVTTQRRHVDDTELVVDGAGAREWMIKAQLFAGPATDGPAPGSRT